MINYRIIYVIAGSIGMLCSSCNIPRMIQDTPIREMPARFSTGTADTLQDVTLNTAFFFKDPYLTALIKDVLAGNPEHQLALQRVAIATAYFSKSKGALLPALNAQILSSGTRYGKYTQEGVGNFDTNLSPNIEEQQKINTQFSPDYWLGLNASWELDLWGRLRSMKKASRHRVLASQQGVHLVQSSLATQTALLYYELIALDKESDIIRDNIQLQEKALEAVTVQREVGRATELALQQMKAQLLNTRSSLFQVQQEIIEIENLLHMLAGKYKGTIRRDTVLALEKSSVAQLSGLPAQLLQNRPDLLEAFEELKASKADAHAARAAFFPTIQVSAYSALSAFSGNVLFSAGSIGYQLLGGITAPLFQQNQIRSQYKIASARQQSALISYQQVALNAYREVENLFHSLAHNRQVIELKTQEVAALSSGVNISNDLYISGYANYLEIVAAQKSKLMADLELIQAEKRQVYAAIHLYKALGGGWKK